MLSGFGADRRSVYEAVAFPGKLLVPGQGRSVLGLGAPVVAVYLVAHFFGLPVRIAM